MKVPFLHPEIIAVTSRDRGVRSDSSHRFERGVDYQLQREAIERASYLLTDIAGGLCGPVIEKSISRKCRAKNQSCLRKERMNALLGTISSRRQMISSLQKLGMQVGGKTKTGTVRVTAPSYRFDISIEADLIEEVARVTGFEKIPEVAPLHTYSQVLDEEKDLPLRRLQAVMVDRNYQEVITYSFIDRSMHDLFSPGLPPVELENPISSDMSVMRASLWPGLIKTMQYNFNRQVRDLKVI